MTLNSLPWAVIFTGLILATSIAVYFNARLRSLMLSPLGKHVLLVAALLLLAAGTGHVIRVEANAYAREWTKTLLPLQVGSPEERRELQIQEKMLNPTQEVRLKTQYLEARGRAVHHLDVMIFFFANYYRAISMMMILGGIAGVALFFIANKGWSNANAYVINIFITATALTAYFGAYPSVFKQQDNISDNKRLYLQYVALGNEIGSYGATGASYLPKENATANDFIHHIDDQLAAVNDIAIGLDSSKVPTYKGIFSSEDQNKSGNQNSNKTGNKNKKNSDVSQ
jgi:hypothetical protein